MVFFVVPKVFCSFKRYFRFLKQAGKHTISKQHLSIIHNLNSQNFDQKQGSQHSCQSFDENMFGFLLYHLVFNTIFDHHSYCNEQESSFYVDIKSRLIIQLLQLQLENVDTFTSKLNTLIIKYSVGDWLVIVRDCWHKRDSTVVQREKKKSDCLLLIVWLKY